MVRALVAKSRGPRRRIAGESMGLLDQTRWAVFSGQAVSVSPDAVYDSEFPNHSGGGIDETGYPDPDEAYTQDEGEEKGEARPVGVKGR